MQELLQELYSEELLEEERRTLFYLDIIKFHNIWGHASWQKLRQDFEKQQHSLSQSFLIWNDTSEQMWLLVDFGNKNAYYIDSLSEESIKKSHEVGHKVAEVLKVPHLNQQLKDTQTVCQLLKNPESKRVPKGTLAGFISLIMKVDLGEVDLNRLKRSDLSGSELDFESVHQELVGIHGFFYEILTSSGVSDIPLSEATVQALREYLPDFFEIKERIEKFNVTGENPKEKHTDLLQEITELYHDVRAALDPIIAYLRSTQMGKYQAEFSNFLQEATNKWKDFDEESEAKLQELERLKIARENQLATTSIADHVIFFDEQAEKHQYAANMWLLGSFVFAVGSIFTVWQLWDTIFLNEATTGTAVLLQSLFPKGFLVSVFYIFLNRSIKNYTAEKHLEVINFHRKNALATFEAFAEAAGSNPHIRDQVLLAATNAIFDANQSGYISGKASRPDSSNLIQQIFRSVMPDKGN